MPHKVSLIKIHHLKSVTYEYVERWHGNNDIMLNLLFLPICM